jgi:hypothetical protein
VLEQVDRKCGWLLMIVSGLVWVAILIVPILPFSIAQKALLIPILIVISEAIFWLGILLLGQEFAHRYRQKFNLNRWWQKLRRHRK